MANPETSFFAAAFLLRGETAEGENACEYWTVNLGDSGLALVRVLRSFSGVDGDMSLMRSRRGTMPATVKSVSRCREFLTKRRGARGESRGRKRVHPPRACVVAALFAPAYPPPCRGT